MPGRSVREPDVYHPAVPFEVGRLARLRDGDDLAIVANGSTVHPSLRAAEALAADGVEATVLDAHTVRPFDAGGLCEVAGRVGRLLVAEEHNVIGGVTSACADAPVDAGLAGIKLARLGMPPDEYALIGPPTHLYRHYGLDTDGIAAAARELLAR